MTGIYITVKLLPATEQLNALYAWLLFSALLMGVVTIQNIIELKNGSSIKEKVTTEKETMVS